MVYGGFDVRDGIDGGEGIWAKKDPTHEEWGDKYISFYPLTKV